MAASPYAGIPDRQRWRSGVLNADWDGNPDLYRKKFPITREMRVMTAGSCFAQHIGTNLKRNGYRVIDEEPSPLRGKPGPVKEYGYETYSARYGNIYTARQLVQLLDEAYGRFQPADIVWERGGRYYDALRPGVEKYGLDSPEEVLEHRKHHLGKVRAVVEQADLVIFTFGLTEAWFHKESGTVYPTAPGTIAGEYDPDKHAFVNFTYKDVLRDFMLARRAIRRVRKKVRFLVTVSPVPLAATAVADHVLCSTVHSKSILRTVAGSLVNMLPDVDYFPSYEIIGSPFVGYFYDDTKRNVRPDGVDKVMRLFFQAHQEGGAARPSPQLKRTIEKKPQADDEVVCEEVLLEAFGT